MLPIRLVKNQKGMTLVEVLVAVFILAIVIVPLMGVFASNINITRQSGAISDTSYTAQSLAEELYPLSHSALFAAQRAKIAYGGKYATVQVVPSGTSSGLVSGSACYAHLIFNGGSAAFAGPDGKYQTGSAANTTLSVSGGGYTLSGGISLSGSKPDKPLILIVDTGAAALPGKVTIAISGAACALYRAPTHDVAVSGASGTAEYSNDTPPAKLLVDVLVSVYDSPSASSPSSTVQSEVEAPIR